MARGGEEVDGGAADRVGPGVLAREMGRDPPSPSLVNESTVLSMLPLKPRSTVALRRSSGKPISFNVAILDSNEASVDDDGGGEACLVARGEVGLLREKRWRLEVEDAERRPMPKNLPVLGGSGGGEPSGDRL